LNAVVIDTETTGLDIRTARLIQFGAVRVRNGAVAHDAQMSRLVNPGIQIPARATQVHGIEDKDLVGAPTFSELIPEIEGFLSGAIWIGHTIAYDLAILRREYALAKRSWIEPRVLDVRLLARLAMPGNAYDDLDSICSELGIAIEGRHSALGDAVATAKAFIALLPLLRAQNIRTLAEADAACRARIEQDARAANNLTAPETSPAPDADRVRSLIKVDSFPYRHRVRDVMSTPIITAPGTVSIIDAAALLLDKKVSSVFVPSTDRGAGIVTERDILRAVATNGDDALSQPLDTIATRPLHTVSEGAFIYRAIGRMDRLGIRHLGVIDRNGNLVGALTTRNLLRHRAATAMMLGDQIDSAPDAAALARAWAQLPKMARQLLDEEVDARIISAVISSEICNLTRRAARLAEQRLADAGRGGPPTAYALMVLGSAGRGESLLAADQDHAIVYAEGEPDGPVDQWFAALGEEISTILDTVGVPFCKGGVMSKNAAWRMSTAHWIETVDLWVRRQRPEDLLNVDIFFDALPVHGDWTLAENLLAHAFDVGRHTPSFIALLSESARKAHVPLTLFRRLKTDSDGRIDLKKFGLFPLVAGARVLAIKHGIRTRATPERLQAVIDAGLANESDVIALIEAHRTILTAMLVQQVADTESGIPPSSRVIPDRQPQLIQSHLKEALSAITIINDLVSEGRF
jgi:DNA polymerase-3 subunit epsilon/CBS domain-containing protein